MRIAFVQVELNVFGGTERVLENVIKGLQQKNEVSLFTASISQELAKSFANYGHFEHIEPWHARSRWDEFAFSKRLIEMAADIAEWEPEVVVLNTEPMYEKWLASKTGLRTVVYAHDFFGPRQLSKLESGPSPTKNIGRWAYRRFVSPRRLWNGSLDSAALVICVSHAVERAYLKLNPHLRTAVINNGVDHNWFTPTWEDENYCLCISRYTRQKNLGLLIAAFGDSPDRIVIYGKPTTESQKQYFLSLKSSSPPNIVFEGHERQERLRDVLQRCSVFLHPGKNEAFPLTPIEAMACGKVVVAHNSGGTPECVEGGGFLLGDDPKEWRTVVDELMKSESLRKELGGKALKHSKNFTWTRTTNEISEALQSIVAR
jgi:glycosyltransferase involved in cell wall biosynthesis